MSPDTRDLGGALQLARVIRRLKAQVQPGELGAETVEHLVRRYARVRPPALTLDMQSHYDPSWPRAFEEEKDRLLDAFAGEDVLGVEHIGSTAIPDLPSKNILDIAMARGASLSAERQSGILSELGYQAYGESPIDAGFSWHWRIGQAGDRAFVVHTCAADNPRFTDIRNFRDFLRAFPQERQRYLELKQALAAVPGQTWLDYSVFKKVLVVRITARANAWRQGS